MSKDTGKFTFIDLFAGIGGTRLGFEEAEGKCIFTSERDRYCQTTYRANFPDDTHEIVGDITQVKNLDEIPPHDVLVAGFPCQPFSLAGVSKKNSLGQAHGFECRTQGTLFFDIKRILEYHRPSAFLLENVTNLLSHDRGRTWQIIRSVLEDDLKYTIHYKTIDARGVVPQHRERVFIAGFKEPVEGFSFDNLKLPTPENGPRLRKILHPENGKEKPEKWYTEGELARVSDKYIVGPGTWRTLLRHADYHRKRGNGFGYGLVGPDDVARTLSARYHKDGAEILVKRESGRPRRLTPRECARLMGFPDDWKIPVSDTQAYRQFGNSVVVPVVEAVAKLMRPHILELANAERSRKALVS